jgi:hypothetical protein
MQPQPFKICPQCQQPAVLHMSVCGRCGRVFRTTAGIQPPLLQTQITMPLLPPSIQRLLHKALLPVNRKWIILGVMGALSLLAIHTVLPHSITMRDAQWLEVGMERDSIERHFGPPSEQNAYEDIYNLDDGRRVRIRYYADHANAVTLVTADLEANLHGRTIFGGGL